MATTLFFLTALLLFLLLMIVLLFTRMTTMRAVLARLERERDYDQMELAILCFRLEVGEWPRNIAQLKASGHMITPFGTSDERWRIQWNPSNHSHEVLELCYVEPDGRVWPSRRVVCTVRK